MKNKKSGHILIGIILFALWVGAGVYWSSHREDITLIDSEQERQVGWFSLINPLIECEIQNLSSQQKYIPFEKTLRDDIESSIMSKNPGISISLYFRNMRNGPWFGINEKSEYAPASLMKLPIAISYLKWVEIDPSIWDKKLIGVYETSSTQNISPTEHISEWSGYTIDELIRYALVYSDNDANRTLMNNISPENLFRVFRELWIPIIQELEEWKDDYISVKEYASFFRILYNASYLSRSSSEYLLTVMSESEYKRWIWKPIPADTAVSHKFWERWYIDSTTGEMNYEFHDCGIVYYEKYPYLLCVMTKWDTSLEVLEGIVEEVSEMTYKTISNIYK